MIEIRAVAESDRENIKNLWKACFSDTDEAVELFLNSYYEFGFIACEGDELMAMLFLLPAKVNGREARYLYAAAVDEKFRGLGILHGLLQGALASTSAELCVTLPADEGLYDYYRGLGFKPVTSNKATLTRAEAAAIAKPYELTELVVDGYCGIRSRCLKRDFLFFGNAMIDYAFKYNELYGAKVIKSNYGYAIAEERGGVCYVSELISADENAPYLLTDLLSAFESDTFVFHLSPEQKFIKSEPERFAMIKYLTTYKPETVYVGLTLD